MTYCMIDRLLHMHACIHFDQLAPSSGGGDNHHDSGDDNDNNKNDDDVQHIINASVKRYTIPEYLMIDLNDDLSYSAIDDDLQHIIYSKDSLLGFQHDGIISV